MIYLTLSGPNSYDFWTRALNAQTAALSLGYEVVWNDDQYGVSIPTYCIPDEESAAVFKLQYL